jgi:hypothetical protein
MAALVHLPLVQSYHPTTFLERGVAVPFTTPMLSGARARPGERGGPELIVPSPSGSRGVYVLAWSSVRELCHPTVHDSRLNQKVAAMGTVTPSAIRAAARDVAAEGLAGRAAASAAGSARETEQQEVLVANFRLLLALVEQVEPDEAVQAADEATDSALEARAKRALARIAPRLGGSAEHLATSLENMAPLFAGTGLGVGGDAGRAGRALDVVRRVRNETLAWSQQASDESAEQAAMVANVADLTIGCTESTLADAHAQIRDMTGLLQRWLTEEAKIRQFAARPEWLLDGWEQVCLLWLTAQSDTARRAVLPEMTLMVPVIPREAGDWVERPIEMDSATRFRRTVSLNEDWRTGSAVFGLVARNEQIRALAA